jgi:hypothetical protein
MLISSSRSGSSPVRWNCRKDLSSAFLYVFTLSFPRILSRSLAIGHAIGARVCVCDQFYVKDDVKRTNQKNTSLREQSVRNEHRWIDHSAR